MYVVHVTNTYSEFYVAKLKKKQGESKQGGSGVSPQTVFASASMYVGWQGSRGLWSKAEDPLLCCFITLYVHVCIVLCR